jgi:hypothetical protein
MFQRTKGFIGVLLATVLLVISTLTIAPAPARADSGTSQAIPQLGGEAWAFAAGLVTGVLISGGSATAVTATAATVATSVATVAASVATVAGTVVAAPVAAPVVIGAGVVGGAYALWQQVSHASAP